MTVINTDRLWNCAVCSVTLAPAHHSCPAHWHQQHCVTRPVGSAMDLHTWARSRGRTRATRKWKHRNTNTPTTPGQHRCATASVFEVIGELLKLLQSCMSRQCPCDRPNMYSTFNPLSELIIVSMIWIPFFRLCSCLLSVSKLSQLQLLQPFVVKHVFAWGVSLFLLEDKSRSGITFLFFLFLTWSFRLSKRRKRL